MNVSISVNRTSVPPPCGTYFPANLASSVVSAQVRPRTETAGVKWIAEVELPVEAEPCEEGSFQRTHEPWLLAWLPSASHTRSEGALPVAGAPACIQPTLSCLLALPRKCLSLNHAHSPPLPSAHLGVNAFSQTRHHQPPADHHQHLLFPVTFSPFMRNTPCPNSLEIPQSSRYILAHLWPWSPTRNYVAPRVIASILYCSALSRLPEYLALLYLIPEEPINSEYPTIFMDSLSVVQKYYFHILNKS